MNDIKSLKPFTRFLMTIGEIPSSYLISMTYEEQLLWFCNYLEKTVIPTVNNNAEAVIELQNYVKNYFDNLDVQEEINNKLDDMAESGQLTDIIAQYLELAGILAFNTKADLKSATNIAEGSTCKTLGNTTYNDGYGNLYKIRTMTSGDVVDDDNILALTISDTLIAEKIPNNYTNFSIKFINTTTELLSETNINIVRAGEIIETLGYSEINDGGATKIYIVDEEPQNQFYFTLQNNLYGIPLSNKENVLIYGVKGDNETDNTSILNSIKNYVNKLYFPTGTYLFNKIQISNKNNYEIYGDGYTSILKCNNTGASSSFTFIDLLNGSYNVHDLFINSNYVGTNTTFAFVNTNNSIITKCKVEGATNQRTINIQSFDEDYGYNNSIIDNLVEKNSTSTNSGALIECTGELSADASPFLHNLRILNNKCICRCTSYTGDIDLFDCIETDNCYDTIIDGNYCETSMHHGISLDTRNVNTICTNNICISTSLLTGVSRNGIEVSGSHGAELMNGIIANNIIKNFGSNGISLNARNYTVCNNRIDTSNRGIILLELCTEGDIISDNICTNITEYGIYCASTVAGARITNNNAGIFLGSGTGNLNFIQLGTPGSNNNIKDGLARIHCLNGVYQTENYNGLNNAGFVTNLLSDGRLIFHNTVSNTWQSISKSNI